MLPKRRSGSSVLTDLEVRAPGRDIVAFAIPFFIALSVYIYSLPPSITLEDAGELVVAADHLGVPHPPGYPLWTVLAWFFQWIFHAADFRGYPNPAWPVALMSAVFGSLACGMVSVCTSKLIRSFAAPAQELLGSAMTGLAPRGAGAAVALITGSLFLFHPGAAGVLSAGLGTLFLPAILLQGLTPTKGRGAFHSRLPSLPQMAHGFWGFLAGSFCFITAWYLIPVPSLFSALPAAFVGVVLILTVSLLLRKGLLLSLEKEHLQRDLTRSGLDILLGSASGLLLAFTPLMYSQSVIVEVYSLNAFFIALLLLLVLAYIHQPSTKLILTIAFLFALGLTNHQSLLFLGFFLIAGVAAAGNRALFKDGCCAVCLGVLCVALLKAAQHYGDTTASATGGFLLLAGWCCLMTAALVFTKGGLFTTWRTLAGLVLVGLLGLSFHLYMPVASDQNPPMNWGNTRTWQGFRHVLTRGQYAGFTTTDNLKKIRESLSPPPEVDSASGGQAGQIERAHRRRTLFLRMLGAYLFDADWKTSIASQFSLQFPTEEADSTGSRPPPPQRTIPFALWGLLPLLMFSAFPSGTRGWFISSIVAMFFLTVVFLLIQWPELDHNDLWVKRVQYVQAHVLYAIWMGLGVALTVLLLYGLLPCRSTLLAAGLPLGLLFVAFPLWKEANDPGHLEHLGASSQRGNEFGWQFGFYQLRGANGILLDELTQRNNPPARLTDWSRRYLQRQGVWKNSLEILFEKMGSDAVPLSEFRKTAFSLFRGSEAEKRWIEEAALLGAFRALSSEEQSSSLETLHRPLPDWDYPPEMESGSILFGGTDPGRFVPTYMVFSADVRPDIFVLTQTALADSTYQESIRQLYGDRIYLPDFLDANNAFLQYANELRLFYPGQFARVMGAGDSMAVSGITEVNRINARLTRLIVERNAHAHSFYFEQAIRMPWMTQHLRPNGLIFKLEPDPVKLTPTEIRKNREFWDWMEEHLMRKNPKGGRNRYQRNLPVRKTYSKLRMAQAWNFFERDLVREAVRAMDQSLRLYPANPEATFRAGELHMRLGRFDRARELVNTFQQHDPEHPKIAPFLRSLTILENLNEERARLEKDLLLKPSGNTALKLLQIYMSLEQDDRTEEMAELILQLPNLHPEFYPNLAMLMQQEENKTYYRKAIETWAEKEPGNEEAWINLAAIALEAEEFTEMMRHLVRAVQLAPVKARQKVARDPRFLDIHHWTQFQRLVEQGE